MKATLVHHKSAEDLPYAGRTGSSSVVCYEWGVRLAQTKVPGAGSQTSVLAEHGDRFEFVVSVIDSRIPHPERYHRMLHRDLLEYAVLEYVS